MQTVEFEEPKPNIMNTSKIPQFKKTLKNNCEKQIILKSNTTSRVLMSPRMNLIKSQSKNVTIKSPTSVYDCTLSPSIKSRGRTFNSYKELKIEHSIQCSNYAKSPKNIALMKNKLSLAKRHKANFSSLSGKEGKTKNHINISSEKRQSK